MNTEFNTLLDKVLKKYNNKRTFDDYFEYIYPFTTENISGYINNFDLENKSLLTVGSSADQVINSAYYNCKNQTVIDICPFSKYYFYLKKAGLLELEIHEFASYFCYKNFPISFVENKRVFNIEFFNKIKGILNELDNESYLFWNELYEKMVPEDIRCILFNMDEERIRVLKEINFYLKDRATYDKVKYKIRDINPNFICEDIFKVEINDKFDNIWLSNIGAYNSVEDIKKLVEKLSNNLNINGKMLIAYLYDTIKNSSFNENWATIYNLDKTNEILKDYISDFITFPGVKGILHENDNIKDSVLIYKKTK